MTDIEIAQSVNPERIEKIAEKIGISEEYLECYGKYKAKVDYNVFSKTPSKNGKLILVTAINPTPAGEGKTTTSIGLADALRKIGKNAVLALREPSLGPVFGVKGGAAGGGYAQVIPMEDINLHFTGDFHAIGAANNLLAAMVDNHIYQGNSLNINPKTISFKRCVDMNDRQLRNIIDGLGATTDGVMREDSFQITVASEIMAIFCLSTSLDDLKERLGRIVIGYSYEGNPITASDIKAVGAMAALLKDAFKPNLVQTLEGTPAFVHGGPFANIAHGCNSIMATKMAQHFGEYVVTEAGFGADLGAEKFLDIKCRMGGLVPDAVVIVATIRALKMHGGITKENLSEENLDAVSAGFANLRKHIENIKDVYHRPVVVAINRFPTDTTSELFLLADMCTDLRVECHVSDAWACGGNGAMTLAVRIADICDNSNRSNFTFAYESSDILCDKIRSIATKIYGAKDVAFSPIALKQIEALSAHGLSNQPAVCIAKTQYSFSDDPTLLGAPKNFILNIRNVYVSAGAGFVVALAGNILTMPGLPKIPAAEKIDVDSSGKISGLF